ncbi:MAG: AMIN domain-containing protein [Terriglobales bacterium]
MKFQPCIRSALVALALLTGLLIASGGAQSTPKLLATTDTPIFVRSVRVLPGPAVEILSSRPLVPAISTLDNPPRLVIDLPNADVPANLSGNNTRIDSPAQEIRRVRVNQYQNAPPVTRVVVDLVKPVGHTWDAAGNRLMVRLRASSDQVTAKPLSVPAFTQGIQPTAVPLGPGSSGSVVLAGSRAAAGSSVTAGSETSVLRLQRGGEVLVCPGTTVSVTSAQSGHGLMLGMNTGALEAHYKLDASADSILTPDFRILLAGPGEFHYAVSADSRGNTCVRALAGNTASVIVSELLGEGNYQVKPTEQIVFHSGRLNLVDAAVPTSCGCPPPEIPVMLASAAPPVSDAKQPSSRKLARDESKPVTPAASGRPSGVTLPGEAAALPPETAALPPSKPNDVHVQVEAPFVFRAADMPANNPPAPKPAPIPAAQSLPVRDLPRPATFETEVLPPAQSQAKQVHHGAFAKIKGFFSAIFG